LTGKGKTLLERAAATEGKQRFLMFLSVLLDRNGEASMKN